MNPRPRAVIAFYSSEEQEQAERAYELLPGSRGSKCIVPRDTRDPPDWCRFYTELRIEGETVVAVEAQASKIGDAVKILRSAGTPSIFVMPQKGRAFRQVEASSPLD